MGCDIHAHVEIKLNGSWEHYSVLDIDRNYGLFAKMANVRNTGEIKPISDPRGMPDYCSAVTLLDCNEWAGDGHSHSWLNVEEIGDLPREPFGWFFGNYLNSFIEHREDFPKAIQDVRIVFWFDN